MQRSFQRIRKACQWLRYAVFHAGKGRNERICFNELLQSDLFKKKQPEVNRK